MTHETAVVTRRELDEMKEAKRELGRAEAYLSTEEALERCPFDLCEETLTGYPKWICPRVRKNPGKAGSALLWDPRDIRALPVILRQWARAVEGGTEDAFRERRERLIREREQSALREVWGEAA